MEAHLYLEAKLPMVGSATDFTYKWCVNMGLDQPAAARMALAVDEILTDIVLYAYRSETGYVEIWYQYKFNEIEIIIQEKGEPFYPDKHVYSPEKAIHKNNFEGAALLTVQKMTDYFIILNRGKDGKEFRLVKQFPSIDIRERMLADSDRDDKEPVIGDEHNYLLTPVTSEDAEDIAKLIYRSYSYSYAKEELYYPKRIEVAIIHEHKFGTIVRTDSGGPAGYFAVVKSTDSMIGEVGEAVVSPPHRKQGLMKRMMNNLIDMSRQRGLLGLFGEALTIHIYSQKVNEKFGFSSTAILIAKSQKRKFKGMDFEVANNISAVVDFLPLTGQWPKSVIIPETYRELFIEIYSGFKNYGGGLPDLTMEKAKTGDTDLDLTIFYEKSSALIIVRNIGNSFEASCRRILRSIDEMDPASVYVDLPLNEQKTDAIIQWLKAEGFILAGLMPLFHNETDYLRMQRIREDIDFDKILTHSMMATKIKEAIKNDYHANRKEQAKA